MSAVVAGICVASVLVGLSGWVWVHQHPSTHLHRRGHRSASGIGRSLLRPTRIVVVATVTILALGLLPGLAQPAQAAADPVAAALTLNPSAIRAGQRPSPVGGVGFDGNRPVPGKKTAAIVGGKQAAAADTSAEHQYCVTVPSDMDPALLPGGVQPGGKLCGTIRTKSVETPTSAPLLTLADGSRPHFVPLPKGPKQAPKPTQPSPSSSASPSASGSASPIPPGSVSPSASPSGASSTTPGGSVSPSGSASPAGYHPRTSGKATTRDAVNRLHAGGNGVQNADFKMSPIINGNGTYLSPNWVQSSPPTEPLMHSGSAMAWDPVRNQIVLFGGSTTTSVANSNAQTWIWANSSWTLLAPSASPVARMDAQMVWDPAISKLVMFGGINTAGADLGDTWTWDGATWAQLAPTTSPSARDSVAMSWDQDLNEIVMFGGQTSLGVFTNDTWTFANNTWTQYQAAGVSGAPTYRAASGMAFNWASTPGQMIMFGGLERSCPTCAVTRGSDTWNFTSTGWSQLAPVSVPPGRGEFGMTYDSGLGAIIITSGENSAGAALSDTWAWNGANWVQAQSGITTQPWYFNPAIASNNSGQVIWQVGPASGSGSAQTWVYDAGTPILGASISSARSGQSTYFVGDTATVNVTAQNISANAITTTVQAQLTSDLNAAGAVLSWGSSALAACTATTTTNCGTSQLPTFTSVAIGAGQTVTGSFLAQIIGNTRGCNNVSIPVFGTDIYGGYTGTAANTTVCGGGLGAERWWTYDTTQLGVGGTAAVNAANGNLLVKQTDTTPIQSHGQLAFELARAYNSQDNMNPTLLGANTLGAGWQWDTSTAGDGPLGLNVGALLTPTIPTSGLLSSVTQALAVTYIDRDGTRDVFTLRSVNASAGPLSLSLSTLLSGLAPNLTATGSDKLCADMAYQAPPGVDMSLYRYVDVGGGCGAAPNSVLGWAVVRPNRERYDFDALGHLVDIVDASGNQVMYNHNANGQMTSITSNRCNNGIYTAGDACPKYTFTYPTVTVGGVTYNETVVVDPAGRTTTYLTQPAAGSNPAELVQVWNPDNPFTTPGGAAGFVGSPSISYTYSSTGHPCTGSAGSTITVGALCSVTDPASGKTSFGYTPAPLGPDRILSVTDRRANATGGQSSSTGAETVYGYTNASDGYSTATVTADTAAPATFGGSLPPTGCVNNSSCERNNYTGIDAYGRVGEVDQGSPTSGTNGSWLHQSAFFWDGNIIVNGVNWGCNGPSTSRDNELCETITRTTPSSTAFSPVVSNATPTGNSANDHVTVFSYDELGLPTAVDKVIDPTHALTAANMQATTYGNHLQYVESDGSVHVFNDRTIGHTQTDYQTDASSSSYYSTVTGDNPSAFYKFDNLTGSTATDSTSNHQDASEAVGTVLGQGGPAYTTSVGEPGNGSWAGYVPSLKKFANGTGSSSAFTVETWVNTTNTGTNYTVCAPCDGTGVVIGRYTGGKPWLFLLGTTSGHSINILAPNSVADGKWHQIDYTYDGSGTAAGAKIFVDGGQVNTGTPISDSLGATTPFRTDATAAYFGDNTTAVGPDGTLLSDLSLYNSALSPTQVINHDNAILHLYRYDTGTLYGVGDQTQMLTPRGNNATNWGDYLTAYRRDEPQTSGSGYPQMNTTTGNVCTGTVQNTGLVCETDTPASAGVPAGVCQNPTAPGGGVPAGGPTDSADAYSCTRSDYYGGSGTDSGTGQDLASATGQKRDSWSGLANATNPAGASTTYRYYTDTTSCSGGANCDLSGNVSAGGWLKTVTDPTGHFVAYAYDRASNIARTWDRNATNTHSVTDSWANATNEPSQAFKETDYTNPVTSNVLSVSAYDTEVITPQGVVSGSGDNSSGQLGNGTTTNTASPVTAGGGLHDVIQIAQAGLGGFNYAKSTFALTGSGTVYGWGQAGSSTPVAISGLPPITQISVGTAHVLALDRTGALWVWGDNTYGELGNNSTTSSTTPIKVMAGVATFSAGGYHSLAVRTDGTVWAWGDNAQGQLGNGSTTNAIVPTQIAGMAGVASVSGGVQTSYAIKTDGTVWAWGDNSQGEIGNGSSASTNPTTPQQIPALGVGPGTSGSHGRVRQIAGSVWGAAALMADGTVWGWGLNNTGQLGGAVSGNSGVPVQIPGVTNQVALAGGWATYLSADETGKVTIWGGTNSGQIGDGTAPAQVTPQAASGYNVSPFSAPWRYQTESRDQLGNRTTTSVDADGMPVIVRPARGNDVFSTLYDTYNTYNAGNLLTTTQAPVERGGAGGTGTTAAPSTFTYDAYGNKTAVTDPRGNASVTDYDLANRVVDVKSTRSTSGNSAGSGCTSSASGSPWSSAQQGHMICVTSTTYDGTDQSVTVTDATGQSVTTAYNALGEKTAQTTPRNDGTYTALTTNWTYNADGAVTDTCPPRQFDAAHEQNTTGAGSCPTNAAYGTHGSIDNAGRVASTTMYRVTGASSATAETTSSSYDADGNPISATDANGHTTTTSYNMLDRKQSMIVPRAAGVGFTTSWTYDPSGDVAAVTAPSANNYGDGTNGSLVVDGSTNPQSNPYKVPAGARYTTVTLQNGGWITAASGMGLVFSANGGLNVCSTCGITMASAGQPGGAGNNQLLGNAPGSPGLVVGGNGGGPGTGSTSGGGGGGGGHNGAGTAGVGGALLQGNGGAGGLTSGTSDFSDVGTNYALAAGGGGGGAGQGLNTVASSAGGNGGGFIHITAPTITVNGTVTAAGGNGGYSANVNGGSGGGAGGGIWFTSDTINLSAANDLTVAGGTGGPNSSSGGPGGNGAPGYIRLDGTTTNAPPGATTTASGTVTAHTYDADHRLIDTITGYQGDTTNVPASTVVPDSQGQVNERTRIGYDADSRKVIGFNPRAFTNVASLTAPNLDFSARSDFNADGRTVATYAPRYDTANPDVASGGDGGSSTDQQTSQCATGADPSVAPGYNTYPATAGVCRTTTTYDANGNLDKQYLASSTGTDNRYQQTTWTDDNLKLSASSPDPSNPGSRVTSQTNLYDGDRRAIKTTDALGHATLTSYTADGLTAETDGQSYTQGSSTITHVQKFTYNAGGQQVTATQPDSTSPGSGFVAADYVTTTTWTSDGLKAKIQAPGNATGGYDITSYAFDNVGNPLTVSSPSANAKDATNPDGVASTNSYTYDNLVAATSNPIVTTINGSPTYRVTDYTYAPSGQKVSTDVGQCTSSTLSSCVKGNSAFNDIAPISYTYAPDGVNISQIGRNNATITTSYDQAGDPTKITATDSTVTITAGYYLDGLLRTAGDGTNTNTYAYDANASLSLRTDQSSASTGITGGAVKKTSYLYGDAGLPAQGTSDVTGANSSWAYDQGGRNTTRTDTSGGSTNRTVTQGFNPDNTVASLAENASNGSLTLKSAYLYDNNGQITQQGITGADTLTNNYTYNPAGNLTTANGTAYTWDHDSNRTGAGSGTATYNADNSLKSTTSAAITVADQYSYAGELTSTTAAGTGCSTTTYDDFQRTLSQHQEINAACGTTGATLNNLAYKYDGLDRAQVTTITNTLGTLLATTRSSYDGLTSHLAGQTGALEGDNTSTATTLNQLNPTGAPVAFAQTPSAGGTTVATWLGKDARGNVTDLIDLSGTSSTCSVEYDPFGNPQNAQGPPVGNGVCRTGGSAASSTANSTWYQSQSRANTFGTYQLGARTYNPATASFTTPDTNRVGTPAADLSVGTDPLTANTYTYVNGNPTNLSDPDGHAACNLGPDCKYVNWTRIQATQAAWNERQNDAMGAKPPLRPASHTAVVGPAAPFMPWYLMGPWQTKDSHSVGSMFGAPCDAAQGEVGCAMDAMLGYGAATSGAGKIVRAWASSPARLAGDPVPANVSRAARTLGLLGRNGDLQFLGEIGRSELLEASARTLAALSAILTYTSDRESGESVVHAAVDSGVSVYAGFQLAGAVAPEAAEACSPFSPLASLVCGAVGGLGGGIVGSGLGHVVVGVLSDAWNGAFG